VSIYNFCFFRVIDLLNPWCREVGEGSGQKCEIGAFEGPGDVWCVSEEGLCFLLRHQHHGEVPSGGRWKVALPSRLRELSQVERQV